MIRARLGLDSWDVLHQGLARQTGLPFGWIVIGVGAVVLILLIPLRQRPGFGTASNVIVVGLAVDAALTVLPHPRPLILRAAFLTAGILSNGIATGLYIGAGMGPGPRDGLMTGLARRGMSIRLARTLIEVTVLATGWLLGGDVGAGTVLYAVSIGPLAHYFIPRLTVSRPDSRRESRPALTVAECESGQGPRAVAGRCAAVSDEECPWRIPACPVSTHAPAGSCWGSRMGSPSLQTAGGLRSSGREAVTTW
jgi:uncharacterized membrane protein YczE